MNYMNPNEWLFKNTISNESDLEIIFKNLEEMKKHSQKYSGTISNYLKDKLYLRPMEDWAYRIASRQLSSNNASKFIDSLPSTYFNKDLLKKEVITKEW